jgi:hypothetical protein
MSNDTTTNKDKLKMAERTVAVNVFSLETTTTPVKEPVAKAVVGKGGKAPRKTVPSKQTK